MNGDPTSDSRRDLIEAEAAAWIARLHRPDRDAETENEFRAWLRRDPAHGRAFEQATGLWNDLPQAGRKFRARRTTSVRFAVAATVLLACALGWFLFAFREDVYSTNVGEQRLIQLEDGSWIALNTDSEVHVRYGRARRQVELKRGEAIFDVAPDRNRPFVVAAQGREVRAVGTSFMVRSQNENLSVTLLEGRVIVQEDLLPWSQASEQPVEMTAGQNWRSQDNALTQLSHARLEQLTAWRRGEIVLDDMPLRLAVVEMNRYRIKPLVIETPAVGDLPVTGVFKIRDHGEFAQTVATVHQLRVVDEENRVLLSGSPTHD